MCCSTIGRRRTALLPSPRRIENSGRRDCLPTFITDSPEHMRLALDAAERGRRPGAERPRYSPRGALPVSRKAGRARRPAYQAAGRRRDCHADRTTERRAAGHVGAGTGAARLHRTTRRFRGPRVARPFDGILPTDPRGHGGRAQGLYPPLQCHAGVVQPRARTDRAGTGVIRCMVRVDRGWRARRSRHAPSRPARPRPAPARDRCDAAGWRKPVQLQPLRTKDNRSEMAAA